MPGLAAPLVASSRRGHYDRASSAGNIEAKVRNRAARRPANDKDSTGIVET